MILVKWMAPKGYFTKDTLGSYWQNTGQEENIGIIMGYVPYPTGTKVVIAPIGHNRPVEVPLSELEFVVNPERGGHRIRKALKDLRHQEQSSNKAS